MRFGVNLFGSNIEFTKDKDISMIKGTKDLIVHKIGGVVANSIDIIIVSKKLGLADVTRYGAYKRVVIGTIILLRPDFNLSLRNRRANTIE